MEQEIIAYDYAGEVIRIIPSTAQSCARLESNVDKGPEDSQYHAAVDGIESLILAAHCAGVDVSWGNGESNFGSAVKTAMFAVGDVYGD